MPHMRLVTHAFWTGCLGAAVWGMAAAAPVLAAPATASSSGSGVGNTPFTYAAWLKSGEHHSVLLSTSSSDSESRPGWKELHTWGDEVFFSGNASGGFNARARLGDNQWHHVAFVSDPAAKQQFLYVDGELKQTGTCEMKPDAPGAALLIARGYEEMGYTLFSYVGLLDDVRLHGRALSAEEIQAAMKGGEVDRKGAPALRLKLDGEADEAARLGCGTRLKFVEGKVGRAAEFNGWSYLEVAPDLSGVRWKPCSFRADGSPEECKWAKEDGLYEPTDGPVQLAQRYAEATAKRCPAMAEEARKRAAGAESFHRIRDMAELHERAGMWLEGQKRQVQKASVQVSLATNYLGLIQKKLGTKFDPAPYRQRLNEMARQSHELNDKAPVEALTKWSEAFDQVQASVSARWLMAQGVDKLVFLKRYTYNGGHYYTEYIQGSFQPGGNLCVLDLKAGSVKELLPELKNGVFERFDVSFDAKRIVFAWKAENNVGYRIYEVNTDGTGFRQVLLPPPDEADLVRRYANGYHHGTDDMSPCYLPDGGICFVSTRCQYGTLCDNPDCFTTTTLFRMSPDGKNLRQLSTSALSEQTPAMAEDGRILYSRWEYVDKGAVSVKCLWSMYPDGSGSREVYGADIALPPTMTQGRALPGESSGYVVMGVPHFPQMGVGTVIRLDMKKDIRTREPMTYMTPYTDIRGEGGFEFMDDNGKWYGDGWGRGPLFRDPYPLSKEQFLVSHKPAGAVLNDPKAYGLYLLDEKGSLQLVYRDPAISCWEAYPLKARKVPPVLSSSTDKKLAQGKLARCVVTDVYHGLEDVPRGTVKYIRVLEQRPRPWTARRYYDGDLYDQQHAVITKDTHLALKVQHGVVPVEEDGSANFLVPADASIFFQVLDANYMAVQTERTFVNYMPGETRACIGCHETPQSAVKAGSRSGTPLALKRAPSAPGPQPGEKDGHRPLDYAQDVQPVWDRNCLKCHSGTEPKGKLNLSGEMTELFNVSYENLIPERRKGFFDRGVLGLIIGENHPKTGNVEYLPARSLGSLTSVLVAMLGKGKVRLADPKQAERAAKLAETHKDIKLTPEELLKVTNWVDTNGQYYGSWWGRRNLKFKGMPDFRPVQTFGMATSNINPYPSWIEK
ncbi:MAG: LamG-like jellyroll fold domain-containing protein [bacterium]